MNLIISVFLLLSVWTIAIIIFAGIYMAVDINKASQSCGLGKDGNPIIFGPAFAFSLETCTTVGYGLPSGTNAFFEDECRGIVIAIYFQMVWSMMFNAFLFAFFFTRIAKSEARGVQVIFSNRAIVSRRPESPHPCISFRVFDIDARHPVVEAHVRLYVVSQKSPIPMPLRVLIPDDDFGAMLYLSLPSQVVHAMDGYSPLTPKTKVKCGASATVPNEGLNLRQADSSTNGRTDVNCPICGESYGTVEQLIRHGKYQKLIETNDGVNIYGSHQEVDWNEWRDLMKKSVTWNVSELEAYFRSSISEIVCVVEGIDPLASGTFQALHSYQVQDICFGSAHFADCVCLNRKGQCVVDLDFFHRINEGERTDRGVFKEETIYRKSSSRHFGASSSRHLAISQQKEETEEAKVEELRLPMIPHLDISECNGDTDEPPTLLRESTPAQQSDRVYQKRQQAANDDHDELLPRNLVGNSKPAPLTSSQLKQPPPAQKKLSEGVILEAESQPSREQDLVSSIPQPRRFSGQLTADFVDPPPLFVVEDELQHSEHIPEPSSSSRRSSRSSIPSNQMNSLITGKF